MGAGDAEVGPPRPNALNDPLEVNDELNMLIDPEFGPVNVIFNHILSDTPFQALVLLTSPASSLFNLYDGSELVPLAQNTSHPITAKEIRSTWGAGSEGVLIVAQNHIQLVKLNSDHTVEISRLVELPHNIMDRGLAATWLAEKGMVAAALVATPNPPTVPTIYPLVKRNCHLLTYNSTKSQTPANEIAEKTWEEYCVVQDGSCALSLSANAQFAVWNVMRVMHAEEASRGDVWGVKLGTEAVAKRLTWHTERLTHVAVSCNGRIVYQGNHSANRPITTHEDLWLVEWDDDREAVPKCLTGGNRQVSQWGWHDDGVSLWLSIIDGLAVNSFVLSLAATLSASQPLAYPVMAPPSWSGSFRGVWATSDMENYTRLYDSGTGNLVLLPHPPIVDDFVLEKVQWQAADGWPIEGLIAAHRKTPPSAPLLVHIHGGPDVACVADRNVVASCTRYPWRHLLQSGYRVFQPMYRGTLGYGDKFSQGLIGVQGQMDGDLGDVISGLNYLKSSGRWTSGKVGIWGGSYGGYMTLRAMAMCPDVFQAGVAMYGYVHNRMVTYQFGDFGFEEEYVGYPCRGVWPLTAKETASDVFEILHHIESPTLLMHGEDDDICPVSQSHMAYHRLRDRGVPTGLVVYSGEKHGFDQPEHQADRDRRMLLWFMQYMAP